MVEKIDAETREQVKFIGQRAEEKIVAGQPMFINEVERTWVRGFVEAREIKLTEIEGAANLSQQAEGLVRAMGKEKAIEMVKAVVLEMLDLPGGNVFGKGKRIKGDESQNKLVGDYVEFFLERQLAKEGITFYPEQHKNKGEKQYKKNIICRIEAITSSANKLLWIMAAEGEEEGKRRQTTKGIEKHLRERVLRGEEKAGGRIEESVSRLSKEEVIRYLPKGGTSLILEHLAGV